MLWKLNILFFKAANEWLATWTIRHNCWIVGFSLVQIDSFLKPSNEVKMNTGGNKFLSCLNLSCTSLISLALKLRINLWNEKRKAYKFLLNGSLFKLTAKNWFFQSKVATKSKNRINPVIIDL